MSALLAAVALALGLVGLFRLAQRRGVTLAGVITSVFALVLASCCAVVYSGAISVATIIALEGTNSFLGSFDEEARPADGALAERGVGARGNFAMFGTTILITRAGEPRWNVTIDDATFYADEAVERANPDDGDYVEPPSGEEYAYVTATITYVGEGSASPADELLIAFEDVDGDLFFESGFAPSAPGVDLDGVVELSARDSVDVNVLVTVPSGAEAGGAWAVSGLWSNWFYVEPGDGIY